MSFNNSGIIGEDLDYKTILCHLLPVPHPKFYPLPVTVAAVRSKLPDSLFAVAAHKSLFCDIVICILSSFSVVSLMKRELVNFILIVG